MTQYLAQDPPIENHWFKPSNKQIACIKRIFMSVSITAASAPSAHTHYMLTLNNQLMTLRQEV